MRIQRNLKRRKLERVRKITHRSWRETSGTAHLLGQDQIHATGQHGSETIWAENDSEVLVDHKLHTGKYQVETDTTWVGITLHCLGGHSWQAVSQFGYSTPGTREANRGALAWNSTRCRGGWQNTGVAGQTNSARAPWNRQ